MNKISEDAKNNRLAWDKHSQEYQELHGNQLGRKDFVWGVWSIPETELNILGNVEGKRVLELGCGAAQLSIAINYLGGHVVGIDNSSGQLEHAKKLLEKHEMNFPLHHCSAEELPFLDGEFDIVFCDHGAMTFSNTLPTLKEAYRVLKPGGLFAFNIQSPLHEVCYDEKEDKVTPKLVKDYFSLGRLTDEGGMVYFQHPIGKWIQMFLAVGFKIKGFIELKAPDGAKSSYDFVPREWASKWPAENIWKLQK